MNQKQDSTDKKRGYLRKDFEVFHIKDNRNLNIEFHSHEFHKIIVFISGNVTYLIEGKTYKLKPWDILLVSSSEIHKPEIDQSEIYERIIIWVNKEFLKKHSNEHCCLLTCFELSLSNKKNLIRLNHKAISDIKNLMNQLESACESDEFGSQILKNSYVLQIVVYISRQLLKNIDNDITNDISYDENIETILTYINTNLDKDLFIENIGAKFYMSKYYLMHNFKKQTGYTIHNYIIQKRLIMSKELIKLGKPITEVYMECGFGDYSNFIRAFRKSFGIAPKKYYKEIIQMENVEKGKKHF